MLNIQDISLSGSKFTWTNNTQNNNLIMKKLEKAYAFPNWLSKYSNSMIQNLPILHLDHALILLYIEPRVITGHRPHKIENWCLSLRQLRAMVEVFLELKIQGSPTYMITRRLSTLRIRLKS